jgi:hypothetical protein
MIKERIDKLLEQTGNLEIWEGPIHCVLGKTVEMLYNMDDIEDFLKRNVIRVEEVE